MYIFNVTYIFEYHYFVLNFIFDFVPFASTGYEDRITLLHNYIILGLSITASNS